MPGKKKGKPIQLRVRLPYSPGPANPQKRGVKGYFTGSRLELLNSYRDEYISLRGKSRAKFWHRFYEHWWSTYPWRLDDHEEPPANDPEKMAELSEVGVDQELKGAVEKNLRDVSPLHSSFSLSIKISDKVQFSQRVTTWFSYRASLQTSSHEGGVWFQLLKRMHEQGNTKPRCRSVPSQFAFEHPEVINAAFAEAYGEGEGLSGTQKMNYRYELAKTLVQTSHSHLVEGLKDRAKEAHEQELKEWSLGLGDIGEAEDIQV